MADGDLSEQIIDAIEAIGGRHEGYRAVHAKGTLCAGTFNPSARGAVGSRAAHSLGG